MVGTTTPLPTTTPQPPTMAPTSPPSSPPTSPPSSPPTSPPTMPPQTFPPTSSPTAAPTTQPPSGAGSAKGQIKVEVCITGASAVITLEDTVSLGTSWDGTQFPAVMFAPFSTTNNNYSAYTVTGVVSGGVLNITVSDGESQTTFPIPFVGDQTCPT